MDFSAVQDFSAKLALLTSAPRVNVPMGCQHQKVIIPCNNGYCLLGISGLVGKVKYGYGQKFVSGIARKPKGTFGGLDIFKRSLLTRIE
jgi:hypothetical protein